MRIRKGNQLPFEGNHATELAAGGDGAELVTTCKELCGSIEHLQAQLDLLLVPGGINENNSMARAGHRVPLGPAKLHQLLAVCRGQGCVLRPAATTLPCGPAPLGIIRSVNVSELAGVVAVAQSARQGNPGLEDEAWASRLQRHDALVRDSNALALPQPRHGLRLELLQQIGWRLLREHPVRALIVRHGSLSASSREVRPQEAHPSVRLAQRAPVERTWVSQPLLRGRVPGPASMLCKSVRVEQTLGHDALVLHAKDASRAPCSCCLGLACRQATRALRTHPKCPTTRDTRSKCKGHQQNPVKGQLP